MNCDAIVTKGSLAWLPKGAEEGELLHLHDFPLIGTFAQRGRDILFACISGATSTTNIWAYLPLSEEQKETIERLDVETTAELESVIHRLFVGQRAAMAIAHDGYITEWSAEDIGENGVLTATIGFIDVVLAQMGNADTQLRRAEQARVDATRQILEPA